MGQQVSPGNPERQRASLPTRVDDWVERLRSMPLASRPAAPGESARPVGSKARDREKDPRTQPPARSPRSREACRRGPTTASPTSLDPFVADWPATVRNWPGHYLLSLPSASTVLSTSLNFQRASDIAFFAFHHL